MTSFLSLNAYASSAVLLSFLLLQLFSLGIAITAWNIARKKEIFHLAFAIILICLFILTVLTSALYEGDIGLMPHPFALLFARLPVGLYIAIFMLGSSIVFYMIHMQHQYRQGMITRTAIKESADNLPAGLCFGQDSGLVILANRSMERLCHTITGNDLQNASAFWETVTKGDLKTKASRLPGTENPIIRMKDGRTWSFTRRIIKVDNKPVIQIIATDTTDLDSLNIQLQESIEELAKMNARLREYSKNIVTVTAKEERLATKVRLHNELGHTLLTTRHILLSKKDDDEIKPILDLWKRNISVLRTGNEVKKVTMLKDLADAAKDVGIVLKVYGTLPDNDINSQLLIITAGSEALNNAVRHASATELYMVVSETDTGYTAKFTNNGIRPEKEIIEGGGLSALRARIEKEFGILEIESHPIFQMKVTVPKAKEEKSD